MEIIAIILILMSAIILHEYAHGYVAYRLGDSTAKLAGRLTLNPIKHIDPVGTIIIPGILIALRTIGMPVFVFGWAKPVPVNFMQLKNPRQDMMKVAIAGPVINILISFICAMIYHSSSNGFVVSMCEFAIFINLLLAFFNLIPIPPLDGSRIVMGLLPRSLAVRYAGIERYGLLIIVGLLYLNIFDILVLPAIIITANALGVSLT